MNLEQGWVAADVLAEFPDLRLRWTAVDCVPQKSPPEIRERLRMLSDTVRGSQAVELRRQAVPHAYRVFFRHVGLDPDRDRPPHEELIVERLRAGRFETRGLVLDAVTIAVVETGVPVWAFDGAAVSGDLGVRMAGEGEEVAGLPAPPGRLVIADGSGAVGVLFGVMDGAVSRSTRRVVLAALQVAGVPSMHVEEALWTAAEIIEEP